MRIERIEAAVCRVALPFPVTLGGIAYPTRDYVALRVRTSDGIDGHALGFTRNAPVAEAAIRMGQIVLGRDPRAVRTIASDLRRSFVQGWDSLARGVSLLDIALWDIHAKAAELPLHRLLGGEADRIPVIGVAGYFPHERGRAAIIDEVGGLLAAGHRDIKLVLNTHTAGWDTSVMEALRRDYGDDFGLSVDAHAAWWTFTDALHAVRPLEQHGLDFLEDPFRPQAPWLTEQLGAAISTPVAVGEDVSGVDALRGLLDVTSILRVDATASGGLSHAISACELASAKGARVLPVVFTALHAQLASVFPCIANVEIIPEVVGADPVEQLLARPMHLEDGSILLDGVPGHGMELDWQRVEAASDEVLRTS